MRLKEIQKKLEIIRDRSFIQSLRKGPTGIGHTLEQELNLSETNLAIPDIGGRVELKATRKNSGSMVTLFTFNRAVWQVPQKEIIKNFGYIDDKGRQSLYSTVFYGVKNPQKLEINIERETNKIHLFHSSGVELGTWSLFTIVGKFISKLERLIIVFADTEFNNETNKEEFHFNLAYLLENPLPDNFIDAFENSQVAIDLRMHINDSGVVRNHGTAFRIKENNIPLLYDKRKRIL